MINFLEETLSAIKEIDKDLTDIRYIGTDNGYIAVMDFLIKANFEYDNDYGSVKIDSNLFIVFMDWSWLERDIYDGSEWWAYKQIPKLGLKKIESIKDWEEGYYAHIKT